MRRVGAFSFITCPNLYKSSYLQTTKVLSDLCFLKKRKKTKQMLTVEVCLPSLLANLEGSIHNVHQE